MLAVDRRNKAPLYAQLYEQIKNDILSGHIQAGTKLQSSRKVSIDLHISRNTVELAYEQLCAEGFIVSRPCKGYYVEALDPGTFHESLPAKPAEEPYQNLPYDFRHDKLHPQELPFARWQRLTNKCFQDYKEELAQCGSVFGDPGLRAQIQKYLYDYRDIDCTAEQIVVGTGTQACFGLICQLMQTKGWGVAMEEPGYDQVRITLRNNGLKVYPVELDEHGLNVKVLGAMNVTAVYVTPSHQYPTGIIMPLSRRLELVEWAKHKNAIIIEDDYNCHFRYNMKPIPSLQSLGKGRVIYLGSFSDLLFPSIRVSYMVIPENLIEEFHKRFDNNAPAVPFLTQKTLELFMAKGDWEKHVRKTVRRQKKKWEALIRALQYEFGDNIRIWGMQGGLHLLVEVKWPMSEDELIHRAAQVGVGVYPTSKYWSHAKDSKKGTVLLNFGGMGLEHIPIAVGLLRQAWLENQAGANQNFKTGPLASRKSILL